MNIKEQIEDAVLRARFYNYLKNFSTHPTNTPRTFEEFIKMPSKAKLKYLEMFNEHRYD
jgi:hypothetical protein